jgi:prepilin peptidase CpaA
MHGCDAVLFGVVGAAVATDVRTGKIRNWLTLPAIAAGPLVGFLDGGAHRALESLAGLGVMVVVAAVLIALRMVGGGDAKLLVAVGSLAGAAAALNVLLYAAVAGGIICLGVMVYRRKTLLAIRALASSLPGARGTVSSGIKIPYSIPIALGVITAIALRVG